jgi:hypothetical protein
MNVVFGVGFHAVKKSRSIFFEELDLTFVIVTLTCLVLINYSNVVRDQWQPSIKQNCV